MNILRGVGTAILSFLLFLSLSVFGMAFLLHSTLLNPDFVADQLEKLDLSDLTRDIVEEQIVVELPPEAEFLKDATLDVIDDQEPWLKEQLHDAIYESYDFFLGKTDRLEITVTLESLKADLGDSLWESLNEQTATWLPDIVKNELVPYLDQNLSEYAKLIPKEYLPPELAGATEQELQQYLEQFLMETEEQINKDNLPEVTGLLESLIKPYYDQYYEEIVEQIPDEIALDEEIPADMMEQLSTARKYIGYFQTGYYALIALMVVLAAGIFLVNWNISKAALALGIDLALYGVLELAGVIFARTFNPMNFLPDMPDIPLSVEAWLSSLLKDILAPLQLFSIIVLVVGAALIVASFFIKRKTAGAQE